jgi:hypothetical protein
LKLEVCVRGRITAGVFRVKLDENRLYWYLREGDRRILEEAREGL